MAIPSELWAVGALPQRQTASVTLLYICLVSHTGNQTLPLQAILGCNLPLPLVTC